MERRAAAVAYSRHTGGVRIDHAIWATRDLDAAAERFERDHGLAAAGGGRHDGLGTHNRIVPLGGGYLELLAVADPQEAAGSPLGRTVAAAAEGWLGWAVVVDDVAGVAARLGTEVTTLSRAGFSAQLTGIAEALAEPALPFFLQRSAETPDPGEGGEHGGLTWVEVAGDAGRLREWLGGAGLPVRVQAGEPALLAVGVGDRELR
jgi:Glyoxalase-like domain